VEEEIVAVMGLRRKWDGGGIGEEGGACGF